MNREEAIEILQEEHNYCLDPAYVLKAIDLAITALSTLQAESEKLRAELEQAREKKCWSCLSTIDRVRTESRLFG